MSARVQPMALLCSLSTLNNFSFSKGDKREDIMTGSLDEGPRYAYLKFLGSSFSSILGGFSTERILRFELSLNSSKYHFL